MALVITNGIYYIYFNEDGKHRKTEDISKAIQYDSVNQAKNYMKKAPAKTKGYYIFDTKQKRLYGDIQEEKREVQEQERCCITSLMEDVSCAEKN